MSRFFARYCTLAPCWLSVWRHRLSVSNVAPNPAHSFSIPHVRPAGDVHTHTPPLTSEWVNASDYYYYFFFCFGKIYSIFIVYVCSRRKSTNRHVVDTSHVPGTNSLVLGSRYLNLGISVMSMVIFIICYSKWVGENHARTSNFIYCDCYPLTESIKLLFLCCIAVFIMTSYSSFDVTQEQKNWIDNVALFT